VEDEARVRGIVVGDDDDRPLGRRISGLGDDVPRRAMRQDRATEPQPATADVVPDRGGRPRACDSRERPGAFAATTERERRAGGCDQVREPERPPVPTVGRLGLDPCLPPDLVHPCGNPLGGSTLAVRRRWALV
jgi:hypothetical protein